MEYRAESGSARKNNATKTHQRCVVDATTSSTTTRSMDGTDALHDYDVEIDPSAIEPVEHRTQLDFMAGGLTRCERSLEKYNPLQGAMRTEILGGI